MSENEFLKIGVTGQWNVTKVQTRREVAEGDILPAFYNQSYTLEVRYERKLR